ncbi:MAG: B12-binding domain-containing radical SAM protein [Desulfovermiculus sp.]|nr:B12-binding domain-containing radical SAM protein [Desulfovermiculus sp.]
MLGRAGADTALLDCLHPMWRDIPWPRSRALGAGPWPKTQVPVPSTLRHIPRRLSRYGLPPVLVRDALTALTPTPDAVLIGTGMTYWYPGAGAMAHLVRRIWPRVPIIAGGIYATLCPDHARSLGCFDQIIAGPLEQEDNWHALWTALNTVPPPLPQDSGLALGLDAYSAPEFSVIMGSRGCPYACPYCATSLLHPTFIQKPAPTVIAEVDQEVERGVVDFAFYDDALLVKPQTWLIPLLEYLGQTKRGFRLHTPNALHVRHLTPSLAQLLKQAGLHTVRLGLESSDFSHRLDNKLTRQEWEHGLACLFSAGFSPEQVGAYILFGLPGQEDRAVEATIDLALASGVRPQLAQYSPIPGTPMFAQAQAQSPYPLDQEPLFHNNALWPCLPGGFSWEKRQKWRKRLAGK